MEILRTVTKTAGLPLTTHRTGLSHVILMATLSVLMVLPSVSVPDYMIPYLIVILARYLQWHEVRGLTSPKLIFQSPKLLISIDFACHCATNLKDVTVVLRFSSMALTYVSSTKISNLNSL